MGNKATRMGITARAPIGSADLNRLWQIYDAKKKGCLTKEEARKFLKDLALAAEVDWDGAKADELISLCGGESGNFDYDRFETLLFSFAEDKNVNLSHSMHSRHGIKKKSSQERMKSPPRVNAVVATSSPAVLAKPSSDVMHPLPSPKPKAGQPMPKPAAFEVAGADPAPARTVEATVYDKMPPPKASSSAPASSDLTASRFEPMPMHLPDD